jgi:hypothetical protein
VIARWTRGQRRGAGGFVAIELAAGTALLVFPVALMVASLPGWFDRQSIARQAARDAARAVVLDGTCRAEVASAAAARIAAGSGLESGAVHVELDCVAGTALERDRFVTARVSVDMPAVSVPLIGSVGAWRWTAGHTEPIDPYGSRS